MFPHSSACFAPPLAGDAEASSGRPSAAPPGVAALRLQQPPTPCAPHSSSPRGAAASSGGPAAGGLPSTPPSVRQRQAAVAALAGGPGGPPSLALQPALYGSAEELLEALVAALWSLCVVCCRPPRGHLPQLAQVGMAGCCRQDKLGVPGTVARQRSSRQQREMAGECPYRVRLKRQLRSQETRIT